MISGIKNDNNAMRLVVVAVQSSVASDSLQPHGLQHTRLLCPPMWLEWG